MTESDINMKRKRIMLGVVRMGIYLSKLYIRMAAGIVVDER